MALLRTAAEVFWPLDKSEKWFFVKQDLNYALVWILQTVNILARLEVLLNGAVPGREALDQALKYNPAFFQANYIDLINGPKTEETIGAALEQINAYLESAYARFLQAGAGLPGPGGRAVHGGRADGVLSRKRYRWIGWAACLNGWRARA